MRCQWVAVFLLWAGGAFAAFQLTWGVPAVTLDTNPPIGDSDVDPDIAVDPLGNAVAVWGRTHGGRAAEDIWAASYNHGSRIWSGPVQISTGGSAAHPSVVMDQEGNATFVWEEGFPSQIHSRTLSAAGVWSPPLHLPPAPVANSLYSQERPKIAIAEEGRIIAIWLESVKGRSRVWSASIAPNTSHWETATPLSPKGWNAKITSSNALALNATGSAAVVWQTDTTEEPQIFISRYTTEGWTDPMLVAQGTEPVVVMDPSDVALILWSQDGMIYSASLAGQNLSDAVAVSSAQFLAQRPSAAMDAAGNCVAVFERFDLEKAHKFIMGANLNRGDGAWTSPIEISIPSPAEAVAAGCPRLRLNAIGDGVVIWKEFDGERMAIQGAGYSLGTWSSIRSLSSATSNVGALAGSYDIAVSVNNAGNIMAIWPEDPTGAQVQQIKAAPGVGLAVTGPRSPMLADAESLLVGIGKGRQELHRFPAHSDLINYLEWSASAETVAFYRIYRGNLRTLVGTSLSPRYEDHQRVIGQKELYLITAVDAFDHESGPMAIVVSPIK